MPEKEPPQEPSPNDGKTASIVRYPNRRFYDRSQAKYVTLQEIAAMIRQGRNVAVRDSKTNEDLTSTILMQIILDQHPERMDLLPVPILHMMIRTNDAVLGLLREYFRQSLGYLDFWQKASAFTPLNASMEWLKTLFPASPAAPGSAANPGAEGVQAASSAPAPATLNPVQVEAIVERLAAMERRLSAFDSASAEREATAGQAGEMKKPAAGRKSVRGQRRPRGNK